MKYLAESNRRAEAEAAVAKAALRLEDPLALAQCHEASGSLHEAQKCIHLAAIVDGISHGRNLQPPQGETRYTAYSPLS